MILEPPFRRATIYDASILAQLVNDAGEGLPLYLWGKMAAPGETAWDVGCRRAAREEGSFSYRKRDHHRAGRPVRGVPHRLRNPRRCRADGRRHAGDVRAAPAAGKPGAGHMVRECARRAPAFRAQGLGTKLLGLADETGRSLAKRGMSVIVSDANAGARRLYERCGYREAAMRAMVKEGWRNEGRNWVLLTKTL
jgi:L-amino acid N-acyltransferase YncA